MCMGIVVQQPNNIRQLFSAFASNSMLQPVIVLVVVLLGFTTLLTSQVIRVAFYSELERSDKFCSQTLISAWSSFTCRKSSSLPKEVILRIFTLWKNPSTTAGFEPANLGSSGESVSISQYRALFIVVPLCWQCSSTGTCESQNTVRNCFPADGWFWTFSCRAIVDVSIPYSAVYSPARNDGPMFRHQWWFCLRRCLVCDHNDPNVFGNVHAFVYAPLWVVLGPILHRLYETQVFCASFRRPNQG